MRTTLKSTVSVFLAIAVALGSALAWPGPARAESEAARLVDIVAGLNTLRDKVAGNWALTMKYGWEAADVLDKEYGGEIKIKSAEEDAARLETLLEQGSPEDRLKVEQLLQTLAQIRLAEKNYADSIGRVRNSAAQSLLAQISMAELGGGIITQTDALFFGTKPAPLLEDTGELPLETLERFGFKPEIPRPGFKVETPAGAPAPPKKTEIPALPNEARNDAEELVGLFEELQTPPADNDAVILPAAEGQPPSTDPEMLRAAYKAYQAFQSIRNDAQNVSSDLQWAMYDASQGHYYYKPDLNWLEARLNTIRRLPGLTAGQLKSLDQLPSHFKETLDNIAAFDENLKRKKAARDDLEKLVDSALTQIDELRSDCLSRLREASQ